MQQVFKAHQLCDQDRPSGPFIDSFAGEMRDQGYAQHTRELQVRLVADFGRWLARRGIRAERLRLICFSATFVRERGVGGPQATIFLPCVGC